MDSNDNRPGDRTTGMDSKGHGGLNPVGSDPRSVPTIVVAAGVIEEDGRFLVTRRPRGVHLEGYWEFPGGKCEATEDLAACLRREIREELGVDADVSGELLCVSHEYPERIVELHFFACRLAAPPTPMLGQEMRWMARGELRSLDFPPADEALIALLHERQPAD
jgi:8-oxo-dGTP diphosphatase